MSEETKQEGFKPIESQEELDNIIKGVDDMDTGLGNAQSDLEMVMME